MTPLWTAAELTEATGGTFSVPFGAAGVSIDTRTIQPGDLFVALVGDGRDGHDFVADALAKGAAGAMVHRDTGPRDTGPGPVLRVGDTLAALGQLGGFARERFGRAGGKLVAVTGSVGKTTTKEMLRGALSVFGETHAAFASYNNHWGLPLTLARTPRTARFCIAEIGMNHAGEIAPLSRLARPVVAVITTVAKAHIGNLGSIEAIADEKASIVAGLEIGGVAVLPADSDQLSRLKAAANGAALMLFGTHASADALLAAVQPDENGSSVVADIAGRPVSFRLNAPGAHMAMNAVATLAVVAALGFDPRRALPALEAFAPLSGRGLRREIAVPGGKALLLDESYNGNGASMRAALDVLRLQTGRRRIAVLGDMLELGTEGPSEHAALAGDVAGAADLLFTCGPLMQNLFDAVPASLRGAHAANSAALAPVAAAALRPGDAVLVKGSLGSAMKRVIDAIESQSVPPPSATGAV
jgi:UDP-N-acetylmuramoyl-tripeptide--D-alanyl-D-alanine ligase